MKEYLISLECHYPEDYDLWIKGVIEDYEAHTGLFVQAETVQQALEWGAVVAMRLLNHVHATQGLTLKQFQHECSLEVNPDQSDWAHCLGFFQHVAYGEMPELDRMTTAAYARWQEDNA